MDYKQIKKAFTETVLRPKFGQSGDLEEYLLTGLEQVLKTVAQPTVSPPQSEKEPLAKFLSPDPNNRFKDFLAFLATAGEVLLGKPSFESSNFGCFGETATTGIIWPLFVEKDRLGVLLFRHKADIYQGRLPNNLLPKNDKRRGEEVTLVYDWDTRQRTDGHKAIPFP